MGYKQTVPSGGKWSGDYWVLDYDDVLNAKSYKQIVLRNVKGTELVIPQLVDKSAPVIYPLVDNIVRFPFEKRVTLSQQDADNRQLQLSTSLTKSESDGEAAGLHVSSPAPEPEGAGVPSPRQPRQLMVSTGTTLDSQLQPSPQNLTNGNYNDICLFDTLINHDERSSHQTRVLTTVQCR